jgi:hypothetical protein
MKVVAILLAVAILVFALLRRARRQKRDASESEASGPSDR